MQELDITVEEIRSLISSGSLVNDERMSRLARDLMEVSRPVISRLRRCDELLQKGLRSEAIHLAKTEPDLLDQVDKLAFPERELWDTNLIMHGLPVAPKALESSVAALHRAFVDEEPLRPFLVKQRLLALSKSSFLDRLSNLEELSRRDPSNLAFQEDLMQFEQARIKMIQAELTKAKASQNTEALIRIVEEVEGHRWLVPLPERFQREIREVAEKTRVVKTRQTVSRIAMRVQAAMANTNQEECRKALNEFATVMAELRGHDSIAQPSSIRLADEWLQKMDQAKVAQNEYESGLAALNEAVVRNDVTEEYISSLMEYIGKNGRMPPDLAQACELKLEQLHARRKQKETTILVVSLVAGTLCLILFLLFVMRRG